MRKWRKYILDPSIKGKEYLGIDKTFDEHAKSITDMMQMKAMQARLLFSISTLKYHLGRLENYDNFLRKHLS